MANEYYVWQLGDWSGESLDERVSTERDDWLIEIGPSIGLRMGDNVIRVVVTDEVMDESDLVNLLQDNGVYLAQPLDKVWYLDWHAYDCDYEIEWLRDSVKSGSKAQYVDWFDIACAFGKVYEREMAKWPRRMHEFLMVKSGMGGGAR